MRKAKRIFVISDFKLDKPQAVFVEERRLVKALIRLGHDVQRFRYRNVMMQCSPFPSKKIVLRFAKKKTDQLLVEQIRMISLEFVPERIENSLGCIDYLAKFGNAEFNYCLNDSNSFVLSA